MLSDEAKTKEQLINELVVLRQRVAELGTLESERKLAEEALRESESRFSGIAENALEWIWEVDINGEYTYASPVCEKILGYKPEELLGKHFYDLFLPEEREQLKKAALNTFAKKKPFREFINQNMHKNGEIVWLSTSGVPILDERGNLLGYRGADTDITERKRVEEALRESEERYRALVNLGGKVGEAVVMLQDTEQGNAIYTFVSNEWPRITGYSRKELLGMSFFDLLVPKYHEASLKRHRRKMSGEIIPGLFEMSIITKDGTEVPIEVTSAYTTYKGARANVAFIRDITERKHAEAALKESEEKYRSLVNNVKLGVLRSTPGPPGKVLEVNPAMEEITGYSREELLKMDISKMYVHPEEREAILEEIALARGAVTVELQWRKKDGTEIAVLDRVIAVRDDTGKILYFDAIIEDITERKQAEEREKELQQQLYLSSRLASVGELAAGVAHEISNPLTGILGFSQRLMRKSTDEEVSHDLEIIHSEAQRVAKVVGNLLTFARRREPKKEYLDINDILQQALELRAYELKTSDIEVVTSLAPGLPKTMADFHQIQEVFLNIILNAEQAMSEASGGGKLTIKTQEGKGGIRISFTDDGPGIPSRTPRQAFRPLFHHKARKRWHWLGA